MTLTPLRLTDNQVAVVFRMARQIEGDDERDIFFSRVGAALRQEPHITDAAVRRVAVATFEAIKKKARA